MQYKSMVLLFMMMLGLVFSPGSALGDPKYRTAECDTGEEVPFSKLMYIGQKVNSTLYKSCKKVVKLGNDKSMNDAEAQKACGGGYYLNPGNPQYQESHTTAHGSQGANNLGYYFCLANFSKKKVCEEFGKDPKFSYLHARWEGTSANDGNCMCGNKKGQMHDCGDGIPSSASTDDEKKCSDLGAHYTPAIDTEASCICDSDGTPRDLTSSSNLKCPEKVVKDPHVPGTESQQIKDCVTRFNTGLSECQKLGDKANETCDENSDSNKNLDSTKNFIKGISNMITQKAAGTGAQAQCAGANLIASGAYGLLNTLQGTCSEEIKSCKNKCGEIKDGLEAYCKSSVVSDGSPEGETADEKYIAEQNKEIASKWTESLKVCGQKAVEKEDLLRDTLRAYDGASRSAAMCACKLSASTTDCTTLPGPADCHFDPSNPICKVVDPLGCDVGTENYKTERCKCLQDHSLSFCQPKDGKPPFAFSNELKGNGFAGGGGSSNFGGGGGGGDGMDLGDLSQKDAKTDSKTGPQGDAPGIGFNPSGGGGAGGGSGAGAEAGNGPAAEAGGEGPEKNLGILGLVKNAVGNIFSNKPGAAAANGKGSGKPGYDVDKWRPRGLASTGCNNSQIRCKNEDIFSIMNKRYINNEMSFIQNP